MRKSRKQMVKMTVFFLIFMFLSSSPLMANSMSSFPKPQTDSNGTHYLTGGIGKTEREYFRENKADNYTLKMVFASIDGKYVAGADVVVKDSSGNRVFSSTDNGPWLYVDLPKGRYTIEARLDNITRQRTVHVYNGRLERVMFHWKNMNMHDETASHQAS